MRRCRAFCGRKQAAALALARCRRPAVCVRPRRARPGAGPWRVGGTGRSETLRVCADPHDLPFSNEAGEGSRTSSRNCSRSKLGEPVTYTYYPQVIGFLRNTLNAFRCDVVMGDGGGDDWCRPPTHIITPPMRWCSSPATGWMASVAGGPAAEGQAHRRHRRYAAVERWWPSRADGVGQAVSADRGHADRSAVADHGERHRVRTGSMQACCGVRSRGYYAQHATPPLTVVPLLKEHAQMDFRIAMGVRHSDQDWKRKLDRLIAENQPEIDRILRGLRRAVARRAGQAASAMTLPPARRVLCAALLMCAGAGNPSARAVQLSHGRLSRADAADVRGAIVLSTEQAHAAWQNHDAIFIECCRSPRVRRAARVNDLAPEAARRHTRQPVAARHRLRCAGAGHAGLFRTRTATGDRRQAGSPGRVLLPGKLLDVVECGETRTDARLHAGRLVPPGDRRLGRARPAAGATHAVPRPQAAE